MFEKIKKPISLLIIATFVFLPVNGFALPTDTSDAVGGTVVSGSATYDSSVANTLTVNQSTSKLIAEYNDFSIGAGETVNFIQPGTSSIALNRVVTGNISNIFGTLSANGRIMLVNQNGIIFGPNSSVDVNGLVASSLGISNTDFINGNYNFSGKTGAVINNGSIVTKPGGYVALLGSRVENNGSIVASVGKIALGAGSAITISLGSNDMINVTDGSYGTGDSGILNTGEILAEGGKVVLNSDVLNGIFDNAINNTGIIEAKNIEMTAYDGDVVLTDGTAEASSNEDAEVSIYVSNGDVDVTDSTVTATVTGNFFQGKASVDIVSKHGSVTAQGSTIGSSVEGYGNADTTIGAFYDGDVNLNGDEVFAKVQDGYSNLDVETAPYYDEKENSGGTINIDNSNLIAKVFNEGEAFVNILTHIQDESPVIDAGEINIRNNSSVIADVDGAGHAEVTLETGVELVDSLINNFQFDSLCEIPAIIQEHFGIDVERGDINISDNSLVHAETGGSNSDTSIASVVAINDINLDATSEISALSAGEYNPSLVLAAAGNNLNAQGLVSAASDYISIVALLGVNDVFAGNVSATGSYDLVPYIQSLVDDFIGGINLGINKSYSSVALIGSLAGDVTLGDVASDFVLAAALGMDDLLNSQAEYEGLPGGTGSIYNTTGDVSSKLTYLLARNDIGTSDNAIALDTDIVAGYSFDEGSIYLDQVTGKTLKVGMFLPVSGDTDLKGIGASLAANDGIVSVVSDGDLIINSIISTNGGVYLKSNYNSIYAGQGWDPSVDDEDIAECGDQCTVSMIREMLMDFPWDMEGPDYLSPIAPVFDTFGEYSYNVIATGYSYFSTPNGTIGVGTTENKDPDISGQVGGNTVYPLVSTVNGDDGLSLDLRFGPPPGYVTYRGPGEEGPGPMIQVWPEFIPGDAGAQSEVHPIYVAVEVIEGAHDARPQGYIDTGDPSAGLTLQIGSELPQPESELLAFVEPDHLRAYYEILDSYRVASFLPATPTTFYAYHPLTPTDSAAFDNISVDAGAYEFIDGSLNMRSPLAPYFGEDEDQK